MGKQQYGEIPVIPSGCVGFSDSEETAYRGTKIVGFTYDHDSPACIRKTTDLIEQMLIELRSELKGDLVT
jgi:hypothetical protein